MQTHQGGSIVSPARDKDGVSTKFHKLIFRDTKRDKVLLQSFSSPSP